MVTTTETGAKCADCDGLGTIPGLVDCEPSGRVTCYACGGSGLAPYHDLAVKDWTPDHCYACGWMYVDCKDCRFDSLRNAI
jgi:hypothetical protein